MLQSHVVIPKQEKNMGLRLALQGGASNGLAYSPLIKEIDDNNIDFEEIAGCSVGAITAAMIAVGMSYDEIRECLISLRGDRYMKFANSLEKGTVGGLRLVYRGIATLFMTRRYIYTHMEDMFEKKLQWEYMKRAKKVYLCWTPIENLKYYQDKYDFKLTRSISTLRFLRKFKFENIPVEALDRLTKSQPPHYFSNDGTYKFDMESMKMVKVSNKTVPMWKAVLASFWNPVFPNIEVEVGDSNFHVFDGGLLDNQARFPFYGKEYYQAICSGEPPEKLVLKGNKLFMSDYNYNKARPSRDKVAVFEPKKDDLGFFDFDDENVINEYDGRCSNIFGRHL